MSSSINLLSNLSRVEIPFIKVTIGDYIFGVFEKQTKELDRTSAISIQRIKYPNYIKNLSVSKVNGSVNKYTLNIDYPITERDDPNFFEKVFSSVADTRLIKFSYGDLSTPSFIYREEEAIITKITPNFSLKASVISYTVDAVSKALTLTGGNFKFPPRKAKPSDIIKEMLWESNDKFGLLDIFSGMRNRKNVLNKQLILDDDQIITIEAKTNISALDYLNYLVTCMVSQDDTINSISNNSIYNLVIVDETIGNIKDDNTYVDGPYFKIVKIDKNNILVENKGIYEIDIGFPSQNIVLDFNLEDNQTYSLLYKYNEKLSNSDYSVRIDDMGNFIDVYTPIVGSNTRELEANPISKSWWRQVTKFPIKGRIQLKGLLRPSILMTHVKLNVLYYGKKHISSGIYVITKQIDSVSSSGFRTTLNLLKVEGDTDVNSYGLTPSKNNQDLKFNKKPTSNRAEQLRRRLVEF